MDRADGVRVAWPLFQGDGSGSTPTSALDLRVYQLDLDTAVRLNRLWHSWLPRLDKRVAWWLCFGAECGGKWFASAIWSLPIARALPQDGTWLELRRFAIAPDAPKNSGSRLLAVMAQLIRRGRPEVVRLVSYQDTEVHSGAIYKAAGWVEVAETRGGEWDTPSRPRPPVQSKAKKRRWEKPLRDV